MTCIVGYRRGGKVWIGGDSAGCAGYDLTLRSDPKVFVNGGVAFGFTSSFRMGQLLAHRLKVPPTPKRRSDLARWMSVEFVDAVRQCLKDGGFASKKEEVESGGTFLVGVRGRLFMIDSDYQVGEPADDFDACGCGGSFAIGVMAAIPKSVAPVDRVRRALATAARFSAGVRGPFRVVSA